jgi:hypothetical protein
MMSKGLITTFTGLLVLGVSAAALAQPKPVPPPVIVAPDFKWQPDVEIAIEKAQQAIEKNQDAFEKLDKLREKFDSKTFELKVPVFDWDGPQMVKLDKLADLAKDLHAMRFDQEGPVKIARRFDECDRSRGGDDENTEGRFYDCGRRAMDESQWDRAADYFGRAAAVKGTRADGALYWKAYAQNRLGQRAEALNTIAELKSTYRQGRWLNDANALEVEVRQKTSAPVTPDAAADDEIKIIAVNALGDSPDAVPILERLISGPQSPKLKDRALFVLAQNQSAQARAVLVKIAKGGANPELQLRAVRYLGQIGSTENREILSQVYAASPDVQVKRQIIRSYMEANDRGKLLTVARAETDQSLRIEAVRRLGDMGAGAELAELYAKETSAEVKKTILRGFANSRQNDRLAAVAQSETDPELKRTAIRSLGLNRSAETGAQIVAIYAKDQNRDVREAAIDALFLQNNATALIQLARQEKDPELKRRIISKLAVMKSDEAKQFFLEILK